MNGWHALTFAAGALLGAIGIAIFAAQAVGDLEHRIRRLRIALKMIANGQWSDTPAAAEARTALDEDDWLAGRGETLNLNNRTSQ